MVDERAWTVADAVRAGERLVRLAGGGPLDGAVVAGEACETDDGLPDRILFKGGAYVRAEGDTEYLWRDEPLEGGSG